MAGEATVIARAFGWSLVRDGVGAVHQVCASPGSHWGDEGALVLRAPLRGVPLDELLRAAGRSLSLAEVHSLLLHLCQLPSWGPRLSPFKTHGLWITTEGELVFMGEPESVWDDTWMRWHPDGRQLGEVDPDPTSFMAGVLALESQLCRNWTNRPQITKARHDAWLEHCLDGVPTPLQDLVQGLMAYRAAERTKLSSLTEQLRSVAHPDPLRRLANDVVPGMLASGPHGFHPVEEHPLGPELWDGGHHH